LLIRLSDDPRELLDRSAEFPEKVAAMRKRADVLITDLKQYGTLPIVRP
jgi:hypothetical protein